MSVLSRMCGAVMAAVCAAGMAQAAQGPHVVTLSHTFEPPRASALAALVARFNAASEKDHIALHDAAGDATQAPTLMVVQSGEVAALQRARRIRPLHQVMAQAGFALSRAPGSAAYAAGTVDARGRPLGLPIGLHTPLLFVNRQAFREVGLDPERPPHTWHSLQDALGKLAEAGYACPYTVARPSWVMLDNVSARHHLAVTEPAGRAERLSVNGMLQIRHVALMASWVRARYLHLFGRGVEAEQRFARGECAVLAASSASWPQFVQAAGFEVGVGELPYYDDLPGAPGPTLADGASLWAASGKSRNDYRTAARFVRFLLEPENQLYWQRTTGFLPLNSRGVFVRDTVDMTQPNLRVASQQLQLGPKMRRVTASTLPNSLAVRTIVEDELDRVWADIQPAKQALDNAVERVGAVRE